jgi:hypothetical protein
MSKLSISYSVSGNSYDGYFVDLFVRKSNSVAINMYKGFGYVVYRRVIGYYSGEEDALGKNRTSWNLFKGVVFACLMHPSSIRYAESSTS